MRVVQWTVRSHKKQETCLDAQGAEDWKRTFSDPIQFIGPLTCEGSLGGGLTAFPLLVAGSGLRSWSFVIKRWPSALPNQGRRVHSVRDFSAYCRMRR